MAKNTDEIKTEAQNALAEINQFLESAKSSAATATESQAQLFAVLNEAKAKLEEITNATTEAIAAKTKITDLQTVIATKSQHIEDAQVHADKVRADLDRKLTEATQQATEAEASKARAQSASDAATTVLTEIRTTKGSSETDAEGVAKAREIAEHSAEVAKGLADKSATVEQRITDYEKRLAELDAQSADRLKTIDTLLPGATSAGLAHSLDRRRQTFLKPYKGWQLFFVISLLAIVAVAVTAMWHAYHLKTVPTYDELGRLFLARVPVAGALIWLALHAGREAALAKRLEEDYGYKSAVASSFEGFRRQMADIGVDMKPDSPLAKLCSDTLSTIATPPGRIYDKHELIVSPAKELKQCAQAVADAAKPIIEAAKALKPLS
jgi:hypothetical protein